MYKRLFCAVALALCTFSVPVSAEPIAPNPQTLMDAKFIEGVNEWLSNPMVALSINTQNELRGTLSEPDILALDEQWVIEREQSDKPLISATLSAPLSIYLLRVQAQSLGLFKELFVMDKNGLNVGQSAITGDYWQGDEAKFQKTFPEGPGTVFIDEAEWDDGNKIWVAQLNMTVSDPETQQAIGAITVEVNLTELERRSAPAS